jgi:uncharacterized coiled-coil protein SlyX
MRQATDRMLAALAKKLPAGTRGFMRRASDPDVERRLAALDVRMLHLENALEGLQDALYRQAVREDTTRADLERRTDPERIARELSADARRRGL